MTDPDIHAGTLTAHLTTEPRLTDPDAFYEALIDMHRGLSPEDSERVNAKLILLLANEIGDMTVLREAMSIARAGIAAESTDPSAHEETAQ